MVAAREKLRSPPHRTARADELLTRAVERLPLSGRGRARVARVARSISALAGSQSVLPEHVAAAFEAGAHAVVVGTAITDPLALTRRFAAATPG